MSTSYDNYIHSLLEPNELLIRGKYKRESSTLATTIIEILEYKVRICEQEFRQKEIEWQQYLSQKAENNI